MNAKKRSFFVWLASLILCGLIILVTLFSEWFGISSLWDTTLLKVAKLVSRFSDWVGSDADALKVVAAFIYIALGIMAICCIVTLRSLYKARTEGLDVSKALFTQAIILSVFVILVVAIGNAIINSESDGWLEDVLQLTAAPFLVLAFGIAGYQLNSNCWVERFAFSDIFGKSAFAEGPAEKIELHCPKCRKSVIGHGKFCPTCGTELVASTIPCPQCGKPVAYDAAFCTSCGCDIAKHSKENGDYNCSCGNIIRKELLQEKRLKYCPQCGKEIKRNDSPTQYLKGVCPACGNYRNNGAFCAICGHAISSSEEP